MRSFILVHWILVFLATPARTTNKTRLKFLAFVGLDAIKITNRRPGRKASVDHNFYKSVVASSYGKVVVGVYREDIMLQEWKSFGVW